MSALELFRKKNKQTEEITLDKSWVDESKTEMPAPPPPSASGLDFPDHPDFSENGQKLVLPPVEEEAPSSPKAEPLDNLDPSWKEFLKQNVAIGSDSSTDLDMPSKVVVQEGRATNEAAPAKPTIKAAAHPNGPIFVEAEEFGRLKEDNEVLKVKLQLMDGFFGKIEELREKEGSELRRWHLEMGEMRKKFLLIDDVLLRSER